MFSNIGHKIKVCAQVECWLGIIVSVIFGFILLDNGNELGLIIMIVGALVSWLGSFITYGFGELVENSSKLVQISTPQIHSAYSVDEKLADLNTLKTEGLISEEEYNQKLEELK